MPLTGTDLRTASRLARKRIRPIFDTVSESAAAIAGYKAVTSSYSTRQFDQCEMLSRAITDFSGCDVLLVRDRAGTRISLWRRKS